MPIINVPEVLRKKLQEDGTNALIGVLNQVEQSAKENSIGIVSERFERRLSENIAKVDKRISDETAKLDKRISDETAKLDKRISDETAKLDKRITEEANRLDNRITEEIAKVDKRITDESNRLDKRITEESSRLNQRITDEMAKLRSEDLVKLDNRISALDKHITAAVSQSHVSTLRWLFALWTAQMAATAGLFLHVR